MSKIYTKQEALQVHDARWFKPGDLVSVGGNLYIVGQVFSHAVELKRPGFWFYLTHPCTWKFVLDIPFIPPDIRVRP